jgi:hypothetical protein
MDSSFVSFIIFRWCRIDSRKIDSGNTKCIVIFDGNKMVTSSQKKKKKKIVITISFSFQNVNGQKTIDILCNKKMGTESDYFGLCVLPKPDLLVYSCFSP